MTHEITVWSQINKRLESKLSEPIFRTWFSRVTLSKLDNNSAIIEVPNKFIANWLNENYLDEIKKSFNGVIKKSLDIQIVYTSKSLKRINKPPSKKKSNIANITNIDRSKTFDQFITGECNRFAYSSALKVANKPSNNTYNPLYIYSQSSFGKTHLLNAIGNHIIKKDPNIKIDYISSKKFLSDYNNSIKTKNTHNFLEQYINLSVVLFDDIQLLSNKKRIQEEFLSIFDHLYGEKKQIVISGDRLPNSLKHFNSRITSRLGSGLITEIKPSDNDIKINIIKNNLQINNINIPNDIIIFLAKYSNNYKNLIRNTIRVGTYMSMNNGNINISMVKSLVKGSNKITVKDIQSITSGYFNISTSELLSFKKKRIYSYPRHIAMYLCKKNSDLSYKEIGARFSDRDHSTVIYAIKQIEKRSLENKDIRKDISNLNKLLI